MFKKYSGSFSVCGGGKLLPIGRKKDEKREKWLVGKKQACEKRGLEHSQMNIA